MMIDECITVIIPVRIIFLYILKLFALLLILEI